jgi:hypothetical protein
MTRTEATQRIAVRMGENARRGEVGVRDPGHGTAAMVEPFVRSG